MCYVIVTCRSLLWILVSLVALVLMLSALVSPAWLVGAPRSVEVGNNSVWLTYRPSLGVYTRCKLARGDRFYCSTVTVRGLSTDPSVFPTLWKVTMVSISFGLSIMCLTVLSGMISCCFQSVFRKSIFTLSGSTQVCVGIFYIVGVMLYPMAWGTRRVQSLCGPDASPFYPGDCGLGWGLCVAVVAAALTFVAACLSVPAEKSTSSDRVQDQIHDGNTLICLI